MFKSATSPSIANFKFVEIVDTIKLHVKLEIWAEEKYGTKRYKAIKSTFMFTLLNENLKSKRL